MRRLLIPGLFAACLACVGTLAVGQSPPQPIPSGILKYTPGSGYASAVAGTDYVAPNGNGSLLTNLTPANISAGTAPINVTGSAGSLSTTFASGKLLGGQGTGVPSAVTVGSGLSLSGGTLSASGSGGVPARTYYLSTNGCTPDVDFSTGAKVGGGSATDNAAAINAVLATATATTPVRVIVDGAYAIGSPLLIPAGGHVTVEGGGWDTGFFCLPGTNGPAITNENLAAAPYNPFDPGPSGLPTITTQGNVTVKNIRIHHNRGTYPNGNSSSGTGKDARGFTNGPWYCVLDLATLQGVKVENVWFYDPCTFNVRLNNVTDFAVTGCRFESPSRWANTDGVHVDGACFSGRVSDCWFGVGDDSFALNLQEGYGSAGARFVFSDCVFNNCAQAFRTYGNAVQVDQILIANLTGTISNVPFEVGYASGTPIANGINSLLVQNCNLQITAGSFTYFNLTSPVGNVSVSGCEFTAPGTGFGSLIAVAAGSSITHGNWTFSNCTVRRSGSGGMGALTSTTAPVTFRRLEFRDCRMIRESGVSDQTVFLTANNSISITELVLADCDFDGVTNVVSTTGTAAVSRISARGLRHVSSTASATFAIGAGSTLIDAWDCSPTGPTALYSTSGSGGVLGVAGNATLVYNQAISDLQAYPGSFYLSTSNVSGGTYLPAYRDTSGTVWPVTFGASSNPGGAKKALAVVGASNSGQGTPLTVASSSVTQAGAGSFSVGCWYNATSITNFRPNGFLAKWNATTASAEWMLYIKGDGIHLTVVNGSGTQYDPAYGTGTNTTGAWHFAVGVFDATNNQIKLYHNGTLGSTTSTTGTVANSTNAFVMGSGQAGSGWPFDGSLAAPFKINRALTDAEVSYLYSNGKGRSWSEVQLTSLAASMSFWYDFADNTSPPTSLGKDSTSNALNLSAGYATGPTQTTGPG